jgi:hypothetical protein
MVVFSLVAPSLWVARNYRAFGRPIFSQSVTTGWQAYQGLCFTNFDWWNADDVTRVFQHPVLSQMIRNYCTTDEEMGGLDAEVRSEVIHECVLGRPLDAAFNVAAKGIMLFINWGQVLPYTEVPVWIRWPINAFLAFYWWCVAVVVIRQRKKQGFAREGARFAGLGLIYVALVTIPFAVDARYLLGPFLIMLALALESAQGFKGLMLAGLLSNGRVSRRGSRTP